MTAEVLLAIVLAAAVVAMAIQDSMMRPGSCRAFKPNSKRIEASALGWPDARRIALLHLQQLASDSQNASPRELARQDNL